MRFGDPDFQFAFREEIMRRTQQDEHESVADYLMSSGHVWSVVATVDRIGASSAFQNLLSRLQQSIHWNEVDDLDALEDLTTRVEASYQLSQKVSISGSRLSRAVSCETSCWSKDTLAALSTSIVGSASKSGLCTDKKNKNRATQAATKTEVILSTSSFSETTIAETKALQSLTAKCENTVCLTRACTAKFFPENR